VEERLIETCLTRPMRCWRETIGGQVPPADWQEDGIALRLDKQLLPLVRQQAHELQQLSAQLASLKDALEERKLIEKAKSVLMTHQGMQEEQAWQALRKMAMDKNQRMVEIARALLTVKSLWQVPQRSRCTISGHILPADGAVFASNAPDK
jgi:hypothetical protein